MAEWNLIEVNAYKEALIKRLDQIPNDGVMEKIEFEGGKKYIFITQGYRRDVEFNYSHPVTQEVLMSGKLYERDIEKDQRKKAGRIDDFLWAIGICASSYLIGEKWPKNADDRKKVIRAFSGGALRSKAETADIKRIINELKKMEIITEEEVGSFMDIIDDVEDRLKNGKKAVGWKTLADIIGSEEVDALKDWLGLRTHEENRLNRMKTQTHKPPDKFGESEEYEVVDDDEEDGDYELVDDDEDGDYEVVDDKEEDKDFESESQSEIFSEEGSFLGLPPRKFNQKKKRYFYTRNYFQLPNVVVDEIMQSVGLSEFKLFLAILRKTDGWGREYCRVTQKDLAELTRLSKGAVNAGLQTLLQKGFIVRKEVEPEARTTIKFYYGPKRRNE